MRLRAVLLAGLLACLLPASAGAAVPALRGAAAHPLSESTADYTQELDLLKAAGGNEVRIDMGWATLEYAKSQHAPDYVAKADSFFAAAHERGIKVVLTFWQTPCWASSAPDDVKQDCTGAWYESPRNVQLYPPSNPQDFADAAAWVADRWGDELAAIEVWNEPNYIPYFFNVPDRHTAEDEYAGMLHATYTAVHQAAPGVAVIGPAMLDSDTDFLTGLYDRGLAGFSDGVSLRPFNGGRDPRSTEVPPDDIGGEAASFRLGVPNVRDVMVSHGDAAKKLWFTEIGWSSCVNQPPPATQNSWCVGEDNQAQYVADAYRIVRDDWDFVHLFNVYTLRNTGSDLANREDQMGLLGQDFTAKPSYDAYEAVLAEPVPQPPPSQPTVTTAAVAPPPAPPAAKKKPKAKPVLTRLRLVHGRISFRLAKRARVTIALQRRRGARWARVHRSLKLRGRRGLNRLKLQTVLGKRLLPGGRYRITVATGSTKLRVTFRLR